MTLVQMMVKRRVWARSILRGRDSSSSSSLLRCFASPSSSSFLSSSAASASAAVSDVVVTDAELLSMTPPSPHKKVDPSLLQPRVVVFDGVCHLCHSGVKWVIKADKHRKIKFCCLQSKAAEPYLKYCGVTREEVLHRFLFVEGPGLCHQASTAALRVASYLPLPYSALSGLLIIPKPLRDSVYDYIARHRYEWFGKENKCIVLQDKELLKHFIDREEMMHCDHNYD